MGSTPPPRETCSPYYYCLDQLNALTGSDLQSIVKRKFSALSCDQILGKKILMKNNFTLKANSWPCVYFIVHILYMILTEPVTIDL